MEVGTGKKRKAKKFRWADKQAVRRGSKDQEQPRVNATENSDFIRGSCSGTEQASCLRSEQSFRGGA